MKKEEERVLDIKTIIYHLLKQWKLLIILIFVGIILVNAIQYKKDLAYMENQTLPISIDEVKNQLTHEEKQSVMSVVKATKNINDKEQYLKNSCLMSNDIDDFTMNQIHYLIEIDSETQLTHEEKQEKINNIASGYDIYINSGEYANDIYEKIKTNISSKDINSLITFYFDDNRNFGSSMLITVYTSEKIKEIKNLKDIALEVLKEYSDVLSERISKHNIKIIDEYEFLLGNENFLTEKKSNIEEEINQYYTTINNTETAFSELQNIYCDYLLDKKTNNQSNLNQPKFFNLKSTIMIIFLVTIMFVFINLIKILFSGRIISKVDYKTILNIPYIGSLIIDIGKNIKLCKLENAEYEDYETQIQYLVLKINNICKINHINELALVSSDFSSIQNELYEDLIKNLKLFNIELIKLDNDINKIEYLNKLFSVKKCIFIEKSEKSKIKEINKIVEVCNDNQVEILGVIDVK